MGARVYLIVILPLVWEPKYVRFSKGKNYLYGSYFTDHYSVYCMKYTAHPPDLQLGINVYKLY